MATYNHDHALSWDKQKEIEGKKYMTNEDIISAACIEKKMFIESIKKHLEDNNGHMVPVSKVLKLFEKSQSDAFPIFTKQLGNMFDGVD